MELILVGLDWREEGRVWTTGGRMGRAYGPNARLDYCDLLADCMFCGVCLFYLPRVYRLIIVRTASSIYYLYALIRRPRLILDFALTLVFNHLVLTTYYSASIPTSFFFWMVMIGGAVLTVIMAEQLCVKREMNEGLSVVPLRPEEEATEEMELGLLLRRD